MHGVHPEQGRALLLPLRADGHSTKPFGCYGYRGNAVTKETKAEALGCWLRLARVTPTSGGSRPERYSQENTLDNSGMYENGWEK
ncbi:hypothetical protein R6Z07F_001652 [Ovis aries]